MTNLFDLVMKTLVQDLKDVKGLERQQKKAVSELEKLSNQLEQIIKKNK